ncbi:MAG TPA: discoidin domain-containing protein, partial [Polyangiaceae bacterium]
MQTPLPVRLAAAVAILALGVRAGLAASRNLALHRPVKISSVLLGDERGAVNGFVEWGSYAVHSRGGGPAWLRVDLERTSPIGEVRIYGRGDGFHTDSGAPIVVELSADGEKFVRAAQCDVLVTQVSPCAVNLGGAKARYVRVSHPTH